MRLLHHSLLPASLGLLVVVGGCAGLKQTDANYSHDKQVIAHQLAHAPRPAPVVSATNARYLAGARIKSKPPLPGFFDQKVVLVVNHGQRLTHIASRISQLVGIPVYVTAETSGALMQSAVRGLQVNQQEQALLRRQTGISNSGSSQSPGTIRVNWAGSLKGLLDYVASRAGVFWRYDQDTDSIRFFLTETRVFNLYALSSNSSVNVNVSDATQGGGGGGAAGQSGNTSQSVTTTSKVNIYQSTVADIHTILEQLSSSGQSVEIPTAVSANPGTGTIVVTATPPVLHQVATYIREINSGLLKQVFISVHVYQVTLNRTDNYGLNLALAFKTLNMTFSPFLKSPSVPGVIGDSSAIAGGMGADVLSGRFANSSAILSALSSQGKVGLVTSASVLAINGQPVPLQVGNQIGYLASSSVSQSANVGTTATLQPGTITTGFSANFMPRILPDGRVLLQYSINLSSLLHLSTVKSGGSEIQTPDVSTRAFLQRAVLYSGQTLVLAGFEQTSDQNYRTGIGSPSNWALGGGYSTDHNRTAIVVSIHVQTL